MTRKKLRKVYEDSERTVWDYEPDVNPEVRTGKLEKFYDECEKSAWGDKLAKLGQYGGIKSCKTIDEAWVLVTAGNNEPIPPMDENGKEDAGMLVYPSRKAAEASAKRQNELYDCNAVAVRLFADG